MKLSRSRESIKRFTFVAVRWRNLNVINIHERGQVIYKRFKYNR